MFDSCVESLNDGAVRRYRLNAGGVALRYGDVLALWRYDAGFRAFFISVLAAAPFTAFRWETPPVTTRTLDRPFEFVLLDSPGLEVTADPAAFAAYFENHGEQDVVVFPNLGRDAILVAPLPEGSMAAYAHIAAFCRLGPDTQQHSLWRRVGEVMGDRLSEGPVWLSTAGGAVPWLHIRLDARPKYYGYAAYRAGA